MRTQPLIQRILCPYELGRLTIAVLVVYALATGSARGEETEQTLNHPELEPPTRVNAEQLRQLRRRQLIAGSTEPNLVWLTTGGSPVMAAWRPDTSGSPRGAVLILPAAEQDPITPAYVRNLHEYFPTNGWATLSLELPYPLPQPIPLRAPPTAANLSPSLTQPLTESTPIDETKVVFNDLAAPLLDPQALEPEEPQRAPALTQEELTAMTMGHIQAGMDFLHGEGHYNVVLLGLGQGAAQGLIYLKQKEGQALPEGAPPSAGEGWVRAVVLIQPHTTYWHQLPAMHELLVNPSIPLLDLYIKDGETASREARLRLQRSRALGYERYIQRGLSAPPPNTGGESWMTKTARGFITRYAEGVEES